MYKIEVHKRIHQAILLFHFVGLLESDNDRVFCKIKRNMHLVLYLCFVVSVALGVYKTNDTFESIFLAVMLIGCIVQTVRLSYILWKMEAILHFIHHMGGYSIKDHEQFNRTNNKIEVFIKFISSFQLITFCANVVLLTIPLYDRSLPLNIYVPLDWKENAMVYWMAYAFVVYSMMLSVVCAVLNVIVWYLMLSCAIKYQMLGNDFKNVNVEEKKLDKWKSEKQNFLLKELIVLIKEHRNLLDTTKEFKLCFESLFFIQIITSGLGICGSVFALAFSSLENPFQFGIYVSLLMYNLFDIFMVLYFGNEIKVSRNSLSYCFFKSNWIEQSASYKRCAVIVMEVLNQPQELVIWKIYPMNLKTFNSILNMAYSMFNILKNLK